MTANQTRRFSITPLKTAGRRFASDCSGAVAIEYVMIVAAIAIAVAAGVSVLGDSIAELYSQLNAIFTG